MSGAVLEGDLRHFFPGEVLQLLQLAGATGRLLLERPAERAELVLVGGRPVFARTSGGSVRTGEVLIHRGAISGETLARALHEQRLHPGERLGTLLIGAGVAREQVTQAVEEVLKRILYGIVTWRDGSFRFVPGDDPRPDDLTLEIELDRLILEGLRQADQAHAAEAR